MGEGLQVVRRQKVSVGRPVEVMSEVLPSEHQLDLSSVWLTGTLTAVTCPDEMSRRYCDMCELRCLFGTQLKLSKKKASAFVLQLHLTMRVFPPQF